MKKGKYLDKLTDIIEDDILLPESVSSIVEVDYKIKKSGVMLVKITSDDETMKVRYPANVAYSFHKLQDKGVRESAQRLLAAVRQDVEAYKAGEFCTNDPELTQEDEEFFSENFCFSCFLLSPFKQKRFL